MLENPEFHKRLKHIDLYYHFNQEAVKTGQIRIFKVPGKLNIANLLTKNFVNPVHKDLLKIANYILEPDLK